MHKFAIAVVFAAGLGLAGTGHAQLTSVSKTVDVEPGQAVRVELRCPDGYHALTYSGVRVDAFGFIDSSAEPKYQDESIYVDGSGNPADYSVGYVETVGSVTSILLLEGPRRKFRVTLFCQKNPANTTETRADASIGAGKAGGAIGSCPAGQTPVDQVSNADGTNLVVEDSFYVWGIAPNFTPIHLLPQSLTETTAPTGIATTARNLSGIDRVFTVFTQCVVVAGHRTFLGFAPTAPGQNFVFSAHFPDGWNATAFTLIAGTSGVITNVGAWDKNGSVSLLDYYEYGAQPVTTTISDVIARGRNTSTSRIGPKAAGLAALGVVATPPVQTPPAPTIVSIVEFFHAALDHYFITASAKEISDLDTGVHPGWQRTNQTFKAYGRGSTGRTGRRPVCRAYGNPAANLDSHFYSASPFECLDTLSRFNGAWLLEASEVFQMDLPDPTTGACPAGDVPIYRVWNNRADSNHRYVTTLALRDQMVARGYIAEGYGPNAVTLCGLL